MSPTDPTSGEHLCQLRAVHGVSWLAGGIVALTLLRLDTPIVFPGLLRPGFMDLGSVLGFVEPLAIVASTVYAVERLTRRRGTLRQFSLKEMLVAVTTVSLVISLTVYHYGMARGALEWTQELAPAEDVDFEFTWAFPLAFSPWFLKLPLFFGVTCLAYVFVEGALWAVRKTTWWLTLNWLRHDDRTSGGESGR